MTIAYKLVAEDVAAYAEYCVKQSGAARITRVQTTVGVVLAAVGTLAAIITGNRSWFFAALVGAFVSLLLTKSLIVRGAIASAQRQQWACFGKAHLMEVTDDGIRSSCEIGDAHIRWSGIREVVQTDEHIFIVVAGGGAYPIARTRVSSGDLQQLVEVVRGKVPALRP